MGRKLLRRVVLISNVKLPFWAHVCTLHGGLICIAFRPSVHRLTSRKGVHLFRYIQAGLHVSNSMMEIANCNSGVKSMSHVTGRCALFNVKLHFWAHLCLCTVGSYASLSVCPWLDQKSLDQNSLDQNSLDQNSLDQKSTGLCQWQFHLTKIHLTKIHMLQINSMIAIANWNSWVKSIGHVYWQVCSLQRQVAFFKLRTKCRDCQNALQALDPYLIPERQKKGRVYENFWGREGAGLGKCFDRLWGGVWKFWFIEFQGWVVYDFEKKKTSNKECHDPWTVVCIPGLKHYHLDCDFFVTV